MQSDSGIASLALRALSDGDEGEYQRCYEELLRRHPDSQEPEMLIRDAGGRTNAIAVCIVNYAFGRAAEIKQLISRLERHLGDEAARESLLLEKFVEQAKREVAPERVQRLYKVLCRHVDPVKATAAFREQDLPIVAPHHLRALTDPEAEELRTRSMLVEVKG